MVKLVLKPAFGSNHKNHRHLIRQHIIENCDLTDLEKKQILDLDQLPKSQKYHFSIAHCKSRGGYAVSSKPIGFDIEEIERISENAVKRISTEEEYPKNIKWLWPAKESMLKLTSAPLVGDCKIIRWHANEFEAVFNHKNIFGSIKIDGIYILALSSFELGHKFEP